MSASCGRAPTLVGAVPTVWSAVLRYAVDNNVDVSYLQHRHLRRIGRPPPLRKAFQEQLGVRGLHAWGMTETSPLAAIASRPRAGRGDDEWTYRSPGRVVAGVECRM